MHFMLHVVKPLRSCIAMIIYYVRMQETAIIKLFLNFSHIVDEKSVDYVNDISIHFDIHFIVSNIVSRVYRHNPDG